MAVKRNDRWRQENPRDQFIAIFSVIEGCALNLEMVSRNPGAAIKIQELCVSAQEILKDMPKGEWDNG